MILVPIPALILWVFVIQIEIAEQNTCVRIRSMSSLVIAPDAIGARDSTTRFCQMTPFGSCNDYNRK